MISIIGCSKAEWETKTYVCNQMDDKYVRVADGKRNTFLQVSYTDEEGNVRFASINDAESRTPLKEGETIPYVDVSEWRFLTYKGEEVVCHISDADIGIVR